MSGASPWPAITLRQRRQLRGQRHPGETWRLKRPASSTAYRSPRRTPPSPAATRRRRARSRHGRGAIDRATAQPLTTPILRAFRLRRGTNAATPRSARFITGSAASASTNGGQDWLTAKPPGEPWRWDALLSPTLGYVGSYRIARTIDAGAVVYGQHRRRTRPAVSNAITFDYGTRGVAVGDVDVNLNNAKIFFNSRQHGRWVNPRPSTRAGGRGPGGPRSHRPGWSSGPRWRRSSTSPDRPRHSSNSCQADHDQFRTSIDSVDFANDRRRCRPASLVLSAKISSVPSQARRRVDLDGEPGVFARVAIAPNALAYASTRCDRRHDPIKRRGALGRSTQHQLGPGTSGRRSTVELARLGSHRRPRHPHRGRGRLSQRDLGRRRVRSVWQRQRRRIWTSVKSPTDAHIRGMSFPVEHRFHRPPRPGQHRSASDDLDALKLEQRRSRASVVRPRARTSVRLAPANRCGAAA